MNFQTFKHLPIPLSSFTSFYQDVIKAWVLCKSSFEKNPPKSFAEIRKQIVWIKSGINYINDIINNDGLIYQTVILEKPMYKANWIAELSKLKTAIPKG